MKDSLELDGVAIVGRTFAEYHQYFDLSDAILKGQTILDIGAGVSSFCAEAATRGYDVIAADPIYSLSPDQIFEKYAKDLNTVIFQLPEVLHKYNWTFYQNIEDLKNYREKTYNRFVSHYLSDHSRYVPAALPDVPFRDKQFDLSLVSYFLFLYSETFDYEFHRKSIMELYRVTRGEVRIYPLTTLRAERSPFVDMLMRDSALSNLVFKVRKVDFEFLKNANELLIIKESKK